jgi:Tetratricopeptide repeat
MFTLLIPLLFFVSLELGLRLISYGPDLSLFTTETIAGSDYLVVNAHVKSRYFNKFEFNPSTSPDYFSAEKPEGKFRIFCLGGSTTVGYPFWFNGSFSSFLRDRLRRLFLGRHIEIINCGMTATNSFTALDMAREITAYEPDLIIDYDGHNEFYGALGVASHESFVSSRWMTNLYLRLIHFRTFLLLRNTVTHIAGLFTSTGERPAGTMMEKLARDRYIPYDSPLYRQGLDTWRQNIRDLIALFRERNIPVIFGTQVSNLRDLPPFVSGFRDGHTSTESSDFTRAFGLGRQLYREGRIDSALIWFRSAAAVDSFHAGVQYMIARCLDSLGYDGVAQVHYVRARDLDLLRFRTSSDFNNVLLEENGVDSHLRTVDMERLFRNQSPDSLIGNTLILEHLHPNSRGYFLLAKGYADAMREMGVPASEQEWRERDTIPDDILWEERSLTSLDERIADRRTQILTSGWPFQSQFPTVAPADEHDTLAIIVEHVTRGEWNWKQAHEAAADYHLTRGEIADAAKEFEVIINQLPRYDVQSYLRLARLDLFLNRPEAAREQLLASVSIEPTILAYRALGDLALQSNHPAEAAPYYEKMSSFPQSASEKAENDYLLGLAYAESGQKERAIAQIVRVLNINPDFRPAIELLTRLNASKSAAEGPSP